MLWDALYTASSSLKGQQYATQKITNNILNVNSPGYHRQDVNLQIFTPLNFYSGNLLQRAYSKHLEKNFRDKKTDFGYNETRSQALEAMSSQIGNLDGNGIDGLLSNLFQSFREVQSDPNSIAYRQGLINQVRLISHQMNGLSLNLKEEQKSIDHQIGLMVDTINQKIGEISEYNSSIQKAEVFQNKELIYSLSDQRDNAINELSHIVGVDVLLSKEQDAHILIGDGLSLVVNKNTQALSLRYDELTQKNHIYMDDTSQGMIDDRLNNGKLGALIYLRDHDISEQIDALDQMAYDLSQSINSIHKKGYGLDGITGRNLFKELTDKKDAAKNIDLDSSIVEPNSIAASESLDGLPGNSSIMKEISDLEQKKVAANNTLSFSGQWANIISRLGHETKNAKKELEIAESVMQNSQNLLEAEIGVSLEQQYLDMQRYQHAHQSALKLISMVDNMLSDMLKLGQ